MLWSSAGMMHYAHLDCPDAHPLFRSTLFRIFDPIIREIDKLVAEQVTKVKILRLQAGRLSNAEVKV